ncbi:MAG TPA: tail fiber domain-containing protein [Chitinophagaceae bacterium]|nr:tail fiber domain-containing protein [Chitinophagaceae bacterium]
MKKFIYFFVTILFANAAFGQNVAVNADGSVAHTSALLDVKSTNKGMLIPRMTTAQRTAIASPATGLLVYDTEANSFWFYNGSAWINITGSGGGGSGVNWKLSGNSGTTPASDFIGTVDDQSLRFKVNNEHYGMLDINGSILWGKHTGMNNTGYSNIAIGTMALYNNTVRSNLVAVGDSALFNNGIGAVAPAHGMSNTAVGSKALFSNTKGYQNTALGYHAMLDNTEGDENVAIGGLSLVNNTTGYSNTAVGFGSLNDNTTGSNNIAIGRSALGTNTIGGENIAIGNSALLNNRGSGNTAIGSGSLFTNWNGQNNTAIGLYALLANQTGVNSTAVGSHALQLNTSSYNTGIGAEAFSANTSGVYNSGLGYSVGLNNTTGSRNNVFGALSFVLNTSGNQNTSIGYQSLTANTTGSFNVALGNSALTGNVAGDYNTSIGYNADVASDSLTNATAIGANALVNDNNKVVIGNSSVTSIGGYANWSNFSDSRFKNNVKEDVPGIAFITKLRPVTYMLNIEAINDFNSKNRPAEKKLITLNGDKKNVVYTGFLAQEVEKAANELGYNFSGIDKPQDANKQTYALRYSDFVVPMIKAIQEQQKMIQELKKEIEDLKKNKLE